MARKSSSRQSSGSYRQSDDNDDYSQPSKEPETSNERFQHIKIPIVEVEEGNQHQNDGDYPKVYEENNEDPPPPNSDEFLAPSGEYEPPEYKPPSSGEIFDEETYRKIVNSVKIPEIRFSGTEKDSNSPIDPDIQIQDDTPEIPPELVDIKIPTSIPKPNVKIKRNPRKKKKPPPPEPEVIKKPKKKSRVKIRKTKDPDQVKEYTQVIDNSNPKEEVIIIKPVKKKKPKSVFFNDDFTPDFQFPQTQEKSKPRIPIPFYPQITLKRKPTKINLVIQNRKKKPILITHQNGDLIYWYPSRQVAPRGNKYVCKRTRFSNQCVNLAQRKPVNSLPRMPKLSSYSFMRTTKPPFHYFDNSDKDSLYYYKVIKSPKKKKKKTIPGGLIQFSQSLFKDDNEETGSFFREIDDQGDEGIDEPEAENHEDERITDDEVENDKATTNDNDEEEGDGEADEEQGQQETPQEVVYDEPEAVDYP